MKKNGTEDELLEHFILVDIERKLIGNKTGASRLGFTVLLKYFQHEARFPIKKSDVPKAVIEYIAKQLNLSSNLFDEYRWGSEERNYTYHRKQIRDFFQFKEFTHTEGERLEQWLKEQIAFTHDTDYLINQVYYLFRKWKVEPPSIRSMKRMIDSAIHTFEQKLYQETYQQLSIQTCHHIDNLLESHDYQEGNKEDQNIITFRQLLSSPHKPSVATMEIELKKLLTIRHLHIPDGLFHHLPPKLITKYQIRAATETITELRANPAPIRYTLLAILFSYRQSEIIDNLADLLDEITHKFENKAMNTTRKEAVAELEKVQGKNKHILNLLQATIDHPDGIIQDTLYPIVHSSTIRDIIKDLSKNNREYKEKMVLLQSSKKVYARLQNTVIVYAAMNNCCNSLYVEKEKSGM